MASLAHYFGWTGDSKVEPGDARDRCSRCGGWISLGHAEGSACREPPQTAEEIAKVLAKTGNG